ncbi:hypothetical protein K474DRAFT_1669564 [Panus rudis PR-1116 ss-1]|nr:hypothetical protein K474DRAFT_1669564 [Panus rudis PR-1116 ss-1]
MVRGGLGRAQAAKVERAERSRICEEDGARAYRVERTLAELEARGLSMSGR